MGGIRPFGDVAALIADGVLTREASLVIGLAIFLLAFFSLSEIFRDLLLRVGLIKNLKDFRIYLSLFWLVIPLATTMALLGLKQPILYLPISFIPSVLALVAPVIRKTRRH